MSDMWGILALLDAQVHGDSQMPTAEETASTPTKPASPADTFSFLMYTTWNSTLNSYLLFKGSQAGSVPSKRFSPHLVNIPLRSTQAKSYDPSAHETAREVIRGLKARPVPKWRLEQAKLMSARLDKVAEEFGLLTARDVDALSGKTSSNPSANPSRWKRNHKVAAIETRSGDLYPGFQFNLATGQPWPTIKPALEAWGASDPVGFTIWCTAPNEWLDGQRPVDCLLDTERVVAAAVAAGE